MSNSFVRWGASVAVGVVALLLGAARGHAQYTNGIYAEFNTSMGSFTCRLEYALAPKAVANFIGLATGQRSWLDPLTGTVQAKPFYNGTTFHRVITNFMNQGGSPNGQGTDGPGYVFVDEFTPLLRHDGFGALSSANSGPDSNGAQYFVTVAPTPWLNDVHTVFGRLYGGSNVVYAINRVATDANNKPLNNVTVNSVIIQRIGTAAQAFNIHAQGLPVVTNLNLKLAKSGAAGSLTFSNRLYADNRLFSSTNLVNWSATQLGIEVGVPVSNSLAVATTLPKQFFRAAQIQYASSTRAPKKWYNHTASFTFTNGQTGTLTIAFDAAGGGTFSYASGSTTTGALYGYDWYQRPYKGDIWPILFTTLPDMTFSLRYTSDTAGVFSGAYYPWGYYDNSWYALSFAGSFTNSP
jgi:peptidyl-prolyl cis-trans isomerase A (cyclophilin A)